MFQECVAWFLFAENNAGYSVVAEQLQTTRKWEESQKSLPHFLFVITHACVSCVCMRLRKCVCMRLAVAVPQESGAWSLFALTAPIASWMKGIALLPSPKSKSSSATDNPALHCAYTVRIFWIVMHFFEHCFKTFVKALRRKTLLCAANHVNKICHVAATTFLSGRSARAHADRAGERDVSCAGRGLLVISLQRYFTGNVGVCQSLLLTSNVLYVSVRAGKLMAIGPRLVDVC